MTSTLSSIPSVYTFTPTSSIPALSYRIPSSLFTAPLLVTLNLCNAPSSFNASNNSIFTAFTNASFAYYSPLYGGFGNITVPLTTDSQDLTVTLNSAGGTDFIFELGVSLDSANPWHVLDRVPLFAFEDSDNANVLLTSPTYSSAILSSAPTYQPFIANSELIRGDLSNSSCYIRSLSSLVPNADVTSEITTRGVVELSLSEGGFINETLKEGKRIQYAIGGLQSGTNYSVWAIQDNDLTSPNGNGSRLFVRQYFSTKRGRLHNIHLFRVSFY